VQNKLKSVSIFQKVFKKIGKIKERIIDQTARSAKGVKKQLIENKQQSNTIDSLSKQN
jgi:hypothetical protein